MFMREMFFSRLYCSRVEDESGRRIGLLRDVAISLASEHPRVVGIRIGADSCLSIDSIAGGLSGDVLRASSEAVLCELKEDEYYAAELLLDKQVVDSKSKRVRCVNDIVFASYGREETEQSCFCAGVDVGIRGLCRRVKAEWLAISQPRLIGWRDIVMVDDGAVPSCMTLSERHFDDVSAKDIVEICRALDRRKCRLFLHRLPPALVCRTMAQMSKAERRQLVLSLANEEADVFIRSLPAAIRRDICAEMPRYYRWFRQAEGGEGT